ncbi:type I-C CRISPR-associated protein Cas7/Csd2 [Phycisphaera mikurensis]|uniref:CRISPR-associated protein n=1 Tax=Phycisphaera mikurensis (strain NBRC 102666 / KCTC 22515 / FYK2301M01) TaxID=1142394 RepID=I0IC62_PHYMF|nr:type I-C CRISPR-associated protein Cas7/Csd2 [Phycisphaera mikurensis]MBB6441931.1 CRISPR-associated protein Csd2 [Phycisphaera mikurensis]BAM02850.1 CRISPR-associated protein [Phycisphaera mikurensis NBRC 102666]
MPEPLAHRYDFAYFFDVTDGNPNGDPDAGNLPRVDPETGHGLVTDVCLKRKVRNYVQLVHEGEPPHEIYVREKAILNQQHERAYKALDVSVDAKKRKDKGDEKAAKDRELTAWMCKNFYDIRTFGAVMTTGVNCGQVRGPVQLGIARSLEPIVPAEHAVTRCAVTTEKESAAQDGDNRTMGRKFTVPYALYRVHGFVNAPLAQQTGFSEDDLNLFKRALDQMFEHDRSAARGTMAPRACIAFRHEHRLGNARADQLFRRVEAKRRDPNAAEPARRFADFELTVDEADLPEGVSVERWVAE